MSKPAAAAAWFGGRSGYLFMYRVSRRPLAEPSLLAQEGMPSDPFEHFVRMLAPGHEVVTGRKNQRAWRVGGIEMDEDERVLTGKLGWVPVGVEVMPDWSDELQDWAESPVDTHGGTIVPFGFEGESRLLVVLEDRESRPETIAAVFEKILRENEQQTIERSTEWSVEPVLDAATFRSWLASLDVVRRVSFTAKLPNPEPTDAFRNLAERMERRRATIYTEQMRSGSEEGLVGIEDDEDFRQALAMGEHGLAKLSGTGYVGKAERRYNQTRTVAREYVPELPPTWAETWQLLKDFLKGQVGRFADEDSR
jgi:hypothetical protein